MVAVWAAAARRQRALARLGLQAATARSRCRAAWALRGSQALWHGNFLNLYPLKFPADSRLIFGGLWGAHLQILH